MLFVGDSLVHNTNFSQVEWVTNTTIKTAKAYSSSWDENARFREKNVTDVVKKEQRKKSFNHIVLGAPTVDISNIDTTNVKPTDNKEVFKQIVGISCKNMMKIAENALSNQPELKNVTIMNHAPRNDAPAVDPSGIKPILANYANSYLLELWLDSPMKNRIFIGSHNLDCSGNTWTKRYTDEQSGRYDGVHLYGSPGQAAYTESVVNILLSSFQTLANDDSHTSCPQTKYKRRTFSSVVTGNSNIKTQNRFSTLGNLPENY